MGKLKCTKRVDYYSCDDHAGKCLKWAEFHYLIRYNWLIKRYPYDNNPLLQPINRSRFNGSSIMIAPWYLYDIAMIFRNSLRKTTSTMYQAWIQYMFASINHKYTLYEVYTPHRENICFWTFEVWAKSSPLSPFARRKTAAAMAMKYLGAYMMAGDPRDVASCFKKSGSLW